MVRTILLASAAILAIPTLAHAQSAPAQAGDQPQAEATDDSRVGEIVVTAQRREESVQNVPIAISAFTAEQLERQGVSNALQIAQFVPNLTAQNNTGLGSANAYYLRGLGSTETIPTFDPPVGTYVDDIYLSRQNANNLSLFDVERVEVLRGPQGTLFGRNTTGGAINVIMRQPGHEIGGYAEVGYGRFEKKLARGSIDLPLADTFSIKLSGYWQDDKGYVKNTTTGERLNDDDGWGARLGVRGELSPDVTWNGSYMHVVNDSDYLLNFECDPRAPSNCNGRFATTGYREHPTGAPVFAGRFTGRKQNYPLGNNTDTDLVTSKFDIGIGENATLSLITGYLSQVQQYGLDFFDGRSSPTLAVPSPAVLGLATGGFTFVSDQQSEQFTQEIKLNGSLGDGLIDYVTGAYYLKENVRDDFGDFFGTLNLVLADRILRNSTKALAGYAQADLNLGQFKFTAGVRYTDETKRLGFHDNRASCQAVVGPTCLDTRNLIVPANGTTVPVAVPIPTKLSTKLWTPRFAINWKPNNDILLFASATRGFKSGGWNARETAPSRILPFGPEKVWSYEIGAKTELFDRRLRANVTAFQLDVTDLQVLSGILNPTTGALTFITRNPANYRNRGVEVELTAVPAEGLNLFVNVGYSDDNYRLKKNVPAFDQYGIQSIVAQQAACKQALAAGKVPTGPNTPATQPSIAACASSIVTAQGTIAEPVRTPDWTLSLGGSYRAEFAGGWALTPSVAASYHSKQEVATSNLTFFTGSISGVNQPATGPFPVNPNSGDIILGSRSLAAWLVNASLALSTPEDRIRFSVECTNCLGESFFQSALANYNYLNQPMTWMVKARYNF
ncbi:TonB-dependent receptor [Novosphingobium sp. Gsoil 351]|uniref:TonB-dependent receptor n=1 Tax=Novosphingobium sp. Gsoil 351 TaxID=2675225 RepID=UPI0012B4B103|nr:TonB-dependent receptor [Novosphingobium sp. Gsoil 351]QGN54441.1 TonB-dependent receptor [Novosphingobium sp. Gsoil 351]